MTSEQTAGHAAAERSNNVTQRDPYNFGPQDRVPSNGSLDDSSHQKVSQPGSPTFGRGNVLTKEHREKLRVSMPKQQTHGDNADQDLDNMLAEFADLGGFHHEPVAPPEVATTLPQKHPPVEVQSTPEKSEPPTDVYSGSKAPQLDETHHTFSSASNSSPNGKVESQPLLMSESSPVGDSKQCKVGSYAEEGLSTRSTGLPYDVAEQQHQQMSISPTSNTSVSKPFVLGEDNRASSESQAGIDNIDDDCTLGTHQHHLHHHHHHPGTDAHQHHRHGTDEHLVMRPSSWDESDGLDQGLSNPPSATYNVGAESRTQTLPVAETIVADIVPTQVVDEAPQEEHHLPSLEPAEGTLDTEQLRKLLVRRDEQLRELRQRCEDNHGVKTVAFSDQVHQQQQPYPEPVVSCVREAAKAGAQATQYLGRALEEMDSPCAPAMDSSKKVASTMHYYKACSQAEAELEVAVVLPQVGPAQLDASQSKFLRDPMLGPRPVPQHLVKESIGTRSDTGNPSREFGSEAGPHIKLMVLTWNMNEVRPKEDELKHWLPKDDERFDVIVVGLQESRIHSSFWGSSTTPRPSLSPRCTTIKASVDAKPFPQSLGPFSLEACSMKPIKRQDQVLCYDMPQEGLVVALAAARIKCGGCLSPPSAFFREEVSQAWDCSCVPASAASFSFAYPTDATEEFLKGLEKTAREEIQADCNCALLLFGGYLYFDAEGICVAAQALLPPCENGVSTCMFFDDPIIVGNAQDNQVIVNQAERFHPVTIADLWKAGAHKFLWISPGEKIVDGLVSGAEACKFGGFLYSLQHADKEELVYFQVQANRADSIARGKSANLGPTSSMKSSGSRVTFKMAAPDGDDNSSNEEREEHEDQLHDFFEMIWTSLGREHWRIVGHHKMWSIQVAVFARQQVSVLHVEHSQSHCGLFHTMGNKGAAVLGMDVAGTSMCFICTHLNAGMKENNRRIEDVHQILNDVRSSRNKDLDVTMVFDHCFWFGDLNFRLDHTWDDTAWGKVVSQVEKKDFESLLKFDQLSLSQKSGEIFTGFREERPNFAPTFKLKKKAGTEYVDNRIPSYTDRVLWFSLPNYEHNIKCTNFQSFPDVSTSDHKPVGAHFEIVPSCDLRTSDLSYDLPLPLYFRHLETENLGGKDKVTSPYVIFHIVPGTLLQHVPKCDRTTTHQHETKHAVWKLSELPLLRLGIRFEKALTILPRATLVLEIKEHSTNGSLGTALVSLDGFQPDPRADPSAMSYVLSFSATVVHNSAERGIVRGEMMMSLSPAEAMRAACGSEIPKPDSEKKRCSSCVLS